MSSEKRIMDNWINTFKAYPQNKPEILAALQADKAQLRADGATVQQQAALATVQPLPLVLITGEEGPEIWNNLKRMAHNTTIQLTNHLFSMMTLVQVTLTDNQKQDRHRILQADTSH